MRQKARYYLWNKTSDFHTGRSIHTSFDDNGLFLPASAPEEGWYFSCVLNSGEQQKHWQRAELQADRLEGASLTITFFTADQPLFPWNGRKRTVEELLREDTISAEELWEIFSVCPHQTFSRPDHMLLTRVRGQYLWFCVRFRRDMPGQQPGVKQIRIWLDTFDWMSYLPEIYQEDPESADFTGRFLGIFQELYEEMNQEITELPLQYDTRWCSREFLEWMGAWIGMEQTGIWQEKQLRELLQRSADLYRRTGTPEMLLDVTELYLGIRPVLLENVFAPDASSAVQALRGGAYAYDPYGFTVLLPEDAVQTEEQHKAILQLLSSYKPAHMRMQLLFVDPVLLSGCGEPEQSGTICLNGRTPLS